MVLILERILVWYFGESIVSNLRFRVLVDIFIFKDILGILVFVFLEGIFLDFVFLCFKYFIVLLFEE